MNIAEVKANLNRNVKLQIPIHNIDAEYKLSGCVIRRNESGDFFYQAELQDLNNGSIVIAALENVNTIK